METRIYKVNQMKTTTEPICTMWKYVITIVVVFVVNKK